MVYLLCDLWKYATAQINCFQPDLGNLGNFSFSRIGTDKFLKLARKRTREAFSDLRWIGVGVRRQTSFVVVQFLANILPIIRPAPTPPFGAGAPLGNPVSATEKC